MDDDIAEIKRRMEYLDKELSKEGERLRRVEIEQRKSTDRVVKVEKESRKHGKILVMMLGWFRALGFYAKPKKRRVEQLSKDLNGDEKAAFRRQMAAHLDDEEETADTREIRPLRGSRAV